MKYYLTNDNHLKNLQLLKRNEFKATAELHVFLIYIGMGMFKQNIYANEGKFETSAQPNIINSASIVQTDLYRLQQPLHPVVNRMSKNYVSHLEKNWYS